ncbi:unnamed protein product [Caenorhabditis auriculariae]|uniref:BTB domain-containing protein n=1 Tax=Caenorhabditis auriculariae TaxID=2777116 RepID=A0A8S1HQE7_9PELO|nr:unnamed protein product [Caenorhabditis auriculariae]
MPDSEVSEQIELTIYEEYKDENTITTKDLKWLVKVRGYEDNVVAVVACDPGTPSTMWQVEAEVRFWLKKDEILTPVITERSIFNSSKKPLQLTLRAVVEIEVFSTSNLRTLNKNSPFEFTENSPDSDLKIIVEGKRLYANKAIMRVFSSYFYGMLTATKEEQTVELENVSYDEMSTLLQAVYPTPLKINESNVETLLKLGKLYGIPSVLIKCDCFLRSPEAAAMDRNGLLRWAVFYELPDLQGFILESFDTAEKIFAVRDSPVWSTLGHEEKASLLERMFNLNCNISVNLSFPTL